MEAHRSRGANKPPHRQTQNMGTEISENPFRPPCLNPLKPFLKYDLRPNSTPTRTATKPAYAARPLPDIEAFPEPPAAAAVAGQQELEAQGHVTNPNTVPKTRQEADANAAASGASIDPELPPPSRDSGRGRWCPTAARGTRSSRRGLPRRWHRPRGRPPASRPFATVIPWGTYISLREACI